MAVRFLDLRNPPDATGGAVLEGSSGLLTRLGETLHLDPFFVELIADNGFKLLLGIGVAVGCVQHSAADGSPPYRMAMTRQSAAQTGHVAFLFEGTPTPVPARYCMSREEALAVAGHFVDTGECFPGVDWDEV